MNCDNSVSGKTILLIIILIILIYIILYKIKENNKKTKKENLENINLNNLENYFRAVYNYGVEFGSVNKGEFVGDNFGKNKLTTIITNYDTNTLTLIQLYEDFNPLFVVYTLNDNKSNTIWSPDTKQFVEKIISDNNIENSILNIKDNSNNILLSIDKYPIVDGIKLKNDLMNNKMFTIQTDDIDPNLFKIPVDQYEEISLTPTSHSPLESIFTDSQLTIEPGLFEMHKKCLNNKADLIQQSLNEFAIYKKDFEYKNKEYTPLTFILNENTRDKIKNIIKNLKTISESEFECLYVKKDAPLNVCKEMDQFDNQIILGTLNQIMFAEKFIILYHNEIIDLKTIVLPKIIHFITVCDKIKKEDKINLLNLLKKIINIINYIAYIIGGNNNLITQIDSSLKSIG
jgi:hypothetical protein